MAAEYDTTCMEAMDTTDGSPWPLEGAGDTVTITEDDDFEYLVLPGETVDEDFLEDQDFLDKSVSEVGHIPFIQTHTSPLPFESDSRKCWMAGQKVTTVITNMQHTHGKTFNPYLYTIDVEHGEYKWTIQRRYKHFRHLHDQLMLFKARLQIPMPSRQHQKRRKSLNIRRQSLPGFPRKLEALIQSEEMGRRKTQLDEYLNAILRAPLFRNHPETLKFLEVSHLSFVQGLGPKLREGMVKKRSGGRRFAGGCCSCFNSFCKSCTAGWSPRWLMLKDTYVAYVRPEDGVLRDVLLMDQDFDVQYGQSFTGVHHGVQITNQARNLTLRCWTLRKATKWKEDILEVAKSTGRDFTEENRHSSFAPLRLDSYAAWYIDGSSYMAAVADAMDKAKEEIFITDWWLSPEIYMKRPMTEGDRWRLDMILKRRAAAGVRIFVILFKEMEMALGINSFYTKQRLHDLHPTNIRVLRHPDGINLWSHHEKVVVIDQRIAFLGGVDLCYGRWDTPEHRLVDLGSVVSPGCAPSTTHHNGNAFFPPSPESSTTLPIPSLDPARDRSHTSQHLQQPQDYIRSVSARSWPESEKEKQKHSNPNQNQKNYSQHHTTIFTDTPTHEAVINWDESVNLKQWNNLEPIPESSSRTDIPEIIIDSVPKDSALLSDVTVHVGVGENEKVARQISFDSQVDDDEGYDEVDGRHGDSSCQSEASDTTVVPPGEESGAQECGHAADKSKSANFVRKDTTYSIDTIDSIVTVDSVDIHLHSHEHKEAIKNSKTHKTLTHTESAPSQFDSKMQSKNSELKSESEANVTCEHKEVNSSDVDVVKQTENSIKEVEQKSKINDIQEQTDAISNISGIVPNILKKDCDKNAQEESLENARDCTESSGSSHKIESRENNNVSKEEVDEITSNEVKEITNSQSPYHTSLDMDRSLINESTNVTNEQTDREVLAVTNGAFESHKEIDSLDCLSPGLDRTVDSAVVSSRQDSNLDSTIKDPKTPDARTRWTILTEKLLGRSRSRDSSESPNSPSDNNLHKKRGRHNLLKLRLSLARQDAVSGDDSGPSSGTLAPMWLDPSRLHSPDGDRDRTQFLLSVFASAVKPSTPKPRHRIVQRAHDLKADMKERFRRHGSKSVDLSDSHPKPDLFSMYRALDDRTQLNPSEVIEEMGLEGSTKLWIGKDYTNFIAKDFVDLHKPFTDFIDRTVTPRMPWHDIGAVVYGHAARDVARHFIQRWNFTKQEKRKTHKDYPLLLPKTYSRVTVPRRVLATSLPCNCQILRSASQWSAGIDHVEHSVMNAYIKTIVNAKHYIYIENQFFISIHEHPILENQIADALFQRIKKAHEEGSRFRVYVVMPLLPAFEGELGTARGASIQAITHWNYASMTRGGKSLQERILALGVPDPKVYLSFFGLRTHGELVGNLTTELVYVHSKLMIVDDKTVIIGSANINDRSMLGNRDSEIATIIEDTKTMPSRMDNQEYEAGWFASSLRKSLFREHMGVKKTGKMIDVTDPVSDEFYKRIWIHHATINTSVYDKVFNCLPTDSVKTFQQLHELQKEAPLSQRDPQEARLQLQKVQGHLVLMPLLFLQGENLQPTINTKEGLAPTVIWT